MRTKKDDTRALTEKEFDAIRRVESRGLHVDYTAIKNALLENAKQGQPGKAIFDAIYKPLYG